VADFFQIKLNFFHWHTSFSFWFLHGTSTGPCNTRHPHNREFNRIAFDYRTRKRCLVAITLIFHSIICSTDSHIFLGATTADTLQAALATLSAAKAATQREQTLTQHTTPTLYKKKYWNPQTHKHTQRVKKWNQQEEVKKEVEIKDVQTKHRGILSTHGVFGHDHSMTSLVVLEHLPFFLLLLMICMSVG